MRQALPRQAGWSGFGGAAEVVLLPGNLKKTVTVALVVGTILFVINQLDVVLRGQATGGVWVKVALTFLVPFAVSNYGILVATHGRPEHSE